MVYAPAKISTPVATRGSGRILVKNIKGNSYILHCKQVEAENKFRWVDLLDYIASDDFQLIDGVDPELFANGKDIAIKRKSPSQARHLLLCRLYAQSEVAKAQKPQFEPEPAIEVVLEEGADLFDATELRTWGACDAAFGEPARFYNGHYLAGYMKKLGELPRDKQGRILYAIKPSTTYQGWTERDPQPVTDC